MKSLKDLKNESVDKVKVLAWLDKIGEFDEGCRNEVLEQCKTDSNARSYYVNRSETE